MARIPWQYSRRSPQGPSRLPRSSLWFEPFGHSPLEFFLAQDSPFLNILEATLDLLANINVVLNFLEGGVFWQFIEHFSNRFLRVPHGGHNLPKDKKSAERKIISDTRCLTLPQCRESINQPFFCSRP